jgi:hypothetical protein
VVAAGVAGTQRAVTAPSAWVQAPAAGTAEASAFGVVANGGMYEVYITGVASEEAGVAELRQKAPGASAAAAVKEVPVPAYDRLEMAPEGVHIRLRELKRPLKAGDTVPLMIFLDNGETLSVNATVK